MKNAALFSILAFSAILIGCDSTAKIAHKDVAPVSTTLMSQEAGAILESSDQFVNRMRVWHDNNGQHSVNAELVAVSLDERSIKLLKDNGVTVDVSIDNISNHDRNFLTQAVNALRTNLVTD